MEHESIITLAVAAILCAFFISVTVHGIYTFERPEALPESVQAIKACDDGCIVGTDSQTCFVDCVKVLNIDINYEAKK